MLPPSVLGVPTAGHEIARCRRLHPSKRNPQESIRSAVYQTAFSNGLPGLYSVSNAILSACEIVGTKLVHRLPRTPELQFNGVQIELGRSVLMVRIRIPGFGGINVYTTHLCGDCSEQDRLEQAQSALGFVQSVEFGKGQLSVLTSQVVFDPLALHGGSSPSVSDHSGLLTE